MAPLSRPEKFSRLIGPIPLNRLTSCSMSEETHDAAIRGPFAIRLAIAVSGVMGAALTITFCFCLTDFEAIMASPTGLPAAQIILNAGGQTGGTIMWAFIILVQAFTGCSAMLADTRMAYTFARDEALPLSRCVFPSTSATRVAKRYRDHQLCLRLAQELKCV